MTRRAKWLQRCAITLMLGLVAILAPHAHAAIITASITTAGGKTIPLTLETATSPEQRAHGLMQRKSLAPYDGMAFFFPQPSIQKFWMKDTVLPLDIVFVDARGVALLIANGVPQSPEPVGPNTPILTVIEIAAGSAAKFGIKPGNTVTYDPQTLTHLDIR